MAVSTDVAAAIARVASALTRYAQARGWKPEDWRLYYRVTPDWDRMHFIVVARELDDQDEFAAYSSIRNYLERELADAPELFRAVGLVVRGFKQIEEGGIYRIGDDFKRIDAEHLEFWGRDF
ncbi:MAG: hypothetical protein IRY99_01345 [Isosphaeraceae bacterium]|nr:hypothetical protein [Isosphaeraceae bacterium]